LQVFLDLLGFSHVICEVHRFFSSPFLNPAPTMSSKKSKKKFIVQDSASNEEEKDQEEEEVMDTIAPCSTPPYTKRDSSSNPLSFLQRVSPMSDCVLGFEPNQHRLSTTSYI
jgi:hypothetical protein